MTRTLLGSCFAVTIMCNPGCSLIHMGDPNHNDKIRYQMAFDHARRALRDVGSELDARADYELMTFWRRSYDERTEIIHDFQLYDFVRRSARSGPDHFVIAYDTATRSTYLRADLRTDENLERLDWPSSPRAEPDSGTTTSR